MSVRVHNVLHLGRQVNAERDTLTATPIVAGSYTPSVVERSASSSTCAANDDSGVCQKPADSGNTGTITIAVAAAVPITLAIVVLFFLHRRVKRKLRAEDASERHKSLDFGMDHVGGKKKTKMSGRNIPEMSVLDVEKSVRPGMRGRGLSMDMSSPYLLPANLHGSRESLHSMSRSMQDSHDPYRPVTFIRGDQESSRSGSSKPRPDNASTFTGSTGRSNDGISADLLGNASRMSRSDPPLRELKSDNSRNIAPRKSSLTKSATSKDRWYPKDDLKHADAPQLPAKDAAVLTDAPHRPMFDTPTLPPFPQPAQQAQRRPEQNPRDYLGFDFEAPGQSENSPMLITPPTPTHDRFAPAPSRHQTPEIHAPVPPRHQSPDSYAPVNEQPSQGLLQTQDLLVDPRRVSMMGLRPLPPDDPTDNPEQRANRIRSFYKEYFDDSRPNPPGQYPGQYPAQYPVQHAQQSPFADEYAGDYFDDGAVYDPETGAMFAAPPPFAQPIGRRAMTPPPGGAAPFMKGHRSVASTQSAGRSARPFYPGSPQAAPKKRQPPPAALKSLPTPHMLRDDSAYSPLDFAPRTTYRDRQLGRAPDSPVGTSRPFSPAVSSHLPLATSYDDLNVMPSPFALRKSSTFTGLDFAPPPRFKNNDGNASDAGSIKSNRSGISTVQRDAIRAGAYRVSRLPKDMVGSTHDLASTLKPTWDMRQHA